MIRSRTNGWRWFWCGALCVVLGGAQTRGVAAGRGRVAQQNRAADTALIQDGLPVLIDPVRTKTTAPQGPPPLPPSALTLRPATVEMRISTGSGTRRQRVTRTADRVHLASNGEREWLYVRNPVDPRRVTGMLIDHRQRVVVVYEDSDLRNHLGIRGWLDVIALGFDASVLESMRPTGRVKRAYGLAFSQHVSAQPQGDVEDVWWSESDFVPLEVVRRAADGRRRATSRIEAYRSEVDSQVLRDPSVRFTGYQQVGFPDWLERLDEH